MVKISLKIITAKIEHAHRRIKILRIILFSRWQSLLTTGRLKFLGDYMIELGEQPFIKKKILKWCEEDFHRMCDDLQLSPQEREANWKEWNKI